MNKVRKRKIGIRKILGLRKNRRIKVLLRKDGRIVLVLRKCGRIGAGLRKD